MLHKATKECHSHAMLHGTCFNAHMQLTNYRYRGEKNHVATYVILTV